MIRDIKLMSDLKAYHIPGPKDPKFAFGVVVFLVRANFKEPRSISVTDFTCAYQDQNTPVFHISKGVKAKRLKLLMDVLQERYNAPDVCDFMNEGKFILLHCQVEVSQRDGVPNFHLFSFNNLNQYPAGALSLSRQSVMKVKSLLMNVTARNPTLKDTETDFKRLLDKMSRTEIMTPSQQPQESKRKKAKTDHSSTEQKNIPTNHTPSIIVNPLFAPLTAMMGSQIAVEEQSQDRLEEDYLTSSGEHTEEATGVVDLTMSQSSDISDGSDIEELSEAHVSKEKQTKIDSSETSGIISVSTFSTQESCFRSTLSIQSAQDKEELPSQNTDMVVTVNESRDLEVPNDLPENKSSSQVKVVEENDGQPEAHIKQEKLAPSQNRLFLSSDPHEIGWDESTQQNSQLEENNDPRMIEKWVESSQSSGIDKLEVSAHLVALSPFRPRIIGKSFNSEPDIIPFQLFVSNLPRSKIDTLLPDKNCLVVDFSTEETIMKFIGYDDIEKAYAANLATYDKLMSLVQSETPVVLNLTKFKKATGCWHKDVWQCEETLDEILQLIR